MEWEDRSFFPYMNVSAHHVISKEVESPSLDTIEFLDKYIDKVVEL